MKWKILSFLTAAVCVGQCVMATVPIDSMALGGIVIGMTKENVESIYGPSKVIQPYRYSPQAMRYFGEIGYGDSVALSMVGRDSSTAPIVELIVVSANNGFATPEGIHVGSPKQEIINAYGRPDHDLSRGEKYGNVIAPSIRKRNIQNLMYRADDRYVEMNFRLENGVVTEISIGITL